MTATAACRTSDSRRISDRREDWLMRHVFSDADRVFIEGAAFFSLATADDRGRADCSFKGSRPDFARVTGAGKRFRVTERRLL